MNLDELKGMTFSEIEHAGVKGMKWGRRKAKPTSTTKKEPGMIKKELSSMKREISTRKDLKNLSKMSEKDIKAKTTRLRNENDLKRLSNRGEYLNRAKLSDTKLQSRINRLRLEDNLSQQIKGANKDNVELANKIITETAKFALTAYTGTVGIQVADTIIKESIKYASQNKVIKQSLDMTPSDLLIMHAGVKGMKWGKRKASYMSAVDKHEAKTKDRRAHNNAKIQTKKDNEKALAKKLGVKYMDASKKHEAKTKERRETPKSEQHKKMVAAAALGTTAVIGAALLSKHYNVTPESVAGSITKGRDMIKKHINTEVQKQLTTKVPDMDKFRKQFDLDMTSVSSTYKKPSSTTKATTKPAVKKESSKKSSSKLDSLFDETAKLAKLLDKGELTPGQSARWRAANDEMIELFKESGNPYIKQSLDMTPSDLLLIHAGVKGMKWGVRKESTSNSKDNKNTNKKKQL